jgi:hypothetical protein
LNRLGDGGELDFSGAGEIGDGAADFEDAAVSAGAQSELVDGHFERRLFRRKVLKVPKAAERKRVRP